MPKQAIIGLLWKTTRNKRNTHKKNTYKRKNSNRRYNNRRKSSKKASIAIITHGSVEKNFRNLLSNLNKNKFILKKPIFIRIEKV